MRQSSTAALLRSHTPADDRWAVGVRWLAAAIFLVFGVGKFVSHASELASFKLYGLPAADAFVYAIGVLEIGGAVLLAIGLLVRPTALALAGNMLGALVFSGIGQGEQISLTLAPTLLIGMCFLVWAGAGRYSVDARLAGALGRRPE